MTYYTCYETGLVGALTLASDGEALVGCWFENDRHLGHRVRGEAMRDDRLSAFAPVRAWLGRYLAGGRPDPRELALGARLTDFQLRVRAEMLGIPYGRTTTYGTIADRIARATGGRASARAVGGAVGRNPLVIIVPCHRVLGAGGSLTGFGGGIPYKLALLAHEGVDVGGLRVPTRGTALTGIDGAAQPWGKSSGEGSVPRGSGGV